MQLQESSPELGSYEERTLYSTWQIKQLYGKLAAILEGFGTLLLGANLLTYRYPKTSRTWWAHRTQANPGRLTLRKAKQAKKKGE
jgi:hypothetical protein